MTSSEALGPQGTQHWSIPLEVVQRIKHEFLKFLLLAIVSDEICLLKSLELIYPLVNFCFD